MKPPEYWTVPHEWAGQTAFILGGGPSVSGQDIALLAGHRVIAVNSAWRTYPQADVLFFADETWWKQFGPASVEGFAGRIVTISSVRHERLLRLRRIKPPAVHLAQEPGTVAMLKTSVAGAVNVAKHFGADTIALLGVDLQFGPDGRRHHHDDRYPRPPAREWRTTHRRELEGQAKALVKVGVEAINCSPISKIRGWRCAALEEVV